ncbi:MAG TPA: hypothetical protein VMW19_17480, partial [Myxococcota bacterium]|nr:hypothetical protein [Myxococcota bacterium]
AHTARSISKRRRTSPGEPGGSAPGRPCEQEGQERDEEKPEEGSHVIGQRRGAGQSGLNAVNATKPILVSALLIAALADNLTDALSIHVFQESDRLDQRDALTGKITNVVSGTGQGSAHCFADSV